MGFKKDRNRAIKQAEEEKKEKVNEFLREIDEVCKKHKLLLTPIINKYGATFEVQSMIEEEKKPETKVGKEEKKEEPTVSKGESPVSPK